MEYSATVHPVVRTDAIIADMWETAGWAEKRGFIGTDPLTFERMVEIKGRPPSRKAQFCTEKLKLVPQRRWLRKEFGPGGQFEGWDYIRYSGIRRDESNERSHMAFESWDAFFDCLLIAPLVEFSKQRCFDEVRAVGEPINPLYSMGFNRIGCAPCVNSQKEDIVMWFLRRPPMIQKVRELERISGRTFFAPCVPGMYINFIDDVLDWALSIKRGGHCDQPALPILYERPACESKYGLCE